MNNDNKKVLKTKLKDASFKFNREYIIFLATQTYLLKANLAAANKVFLIGEAHTDCVQHLLPDYESPYTYICTRLYISLIASFELFVQDLLIAVITAYPKKVGQIEFKLSDILDSFERNELVERAALETLNKIMYEKPLDYLRKISSLLSIDEKTIEPLWQVFVEAKARRDLGLHNGWECNAIYLRKVTEANLTAEFVLGESTLPNANEYITPLGKTLHTLASLLYEEVSTKHS